MTTENITLVQPARLPVSYTLHLTFPLDIAYGTALGPTLLDATASVPGAFAYTPPPGTILDVGTHPLTVLFTPEDTANCCPTQSSVQVNVLQATPTINWPNPTDIDYGTPLGAKQLNATATWVVAGTTVIVPGTFTYAPPAGTVLPAGTHTLSVTFTPADSADYTTATATVQINVLAGGPVILSASFSPTVIQREERIQVTVTVKNESSQPQATQGPDPGFEYSEGDTYLTGARPGRESFPSVAGAYRIAVDTDMSPSPYTMRYLYRWGFGHTLQPGEVVTVTGFIRFHNSRENAPYYVAMIREVNNVVQDHQGTTGITVERP